MDRKAAPPPPPPTTVLRGHSAGVQGLCFLNEQTLLSGDQNGVIKVWNLERRRAGAELQGHAHGFGIQRLERLDARRMVSQGRDGVIKVWDAERLAAAGGTDVGQGRIVSGDGKLAASAASASALNPLFSLPTGAFHFCQFALTRWREETLETTAIQNTYSAGDVDCDGQGNDIERSKERSRRRKHDTRTKVDELARGRRLDDGQREASGDGVELSDYRNDSVGYWASEVAQRDTEEKDWDGRASKIGTEEAGLSHGSFAANTLLAPCHEQHAVSMWDIRARSTAYTITPKDAERKGLVMCVRLLGESPSSASPLALCGHDHGSLCVYDLRATSAEPLVDVRLHKEPVLCIDVDSSGRYGVSGSADSSINIFRLNANKGSCSVTNTFNLERPGTSCVEIRQDQKVLITGGWDHRVRAFSWKNPRPLAVLRSHEESVYGIAYSPRVGVFASCSKDCRVALWDLFPQKT